MKTKYVAGRVKSDVYNFSGAIIIPRSMNHSTVKHLFSEITGAGFCSVTTEMVNEIRGNKLITFSKIVVSVYGGSPSLQINCNPDDIKLLEKLLSLEE